MRILISNDDGWGAKGLDVLIRQMRLLGDVTVVAPDGPRSGKSSALTVNTPIELKLVKDEDACNETYALTVYTCSGMPADCIKLGLQVIMKNALPDMICAGINHGDNSTVNARYSGTMGAVFVGTEHDILSIGWSICDHDPDADFSQFEPHILPLARDILALPPTNRMCWNINAPKGEILGCIRTRQCRGYWDKEMRPYINSEGNTFYMLEGFYVNTEPEAEDTDQYAVSHGLISVCPTTIDMTCYEAL